MLDKVIPKDLVLLIARVLLVALFVLFGWQKITAFGSTTNYFASLGVPLPSLAASAAIVIELGVGPAIALGVRTRPLALLFAFYTVACATMGHRFWSLSGAEQLDAEIHFYKNVAIAGGFLLLYLTGAGRFSLDELAHRKRKPNQLVLGS